jgi:hypothetical protein
MYYNIKIFTDKLLDKGENITLDFDIINHDNAIMYKDFNSFNNSNSLQENYGSKIDSGITKDKDRYFFFEHSIINQPSTMRYPDANSWHSYYIYQITKELFQEISKKNTFNHWDVIFNSLYHFRKYFLSIRKGNYTENLIYHSKLEGDILIIPNSISPRPIMDDFDKCETIGEFLKWHQKQYPNTNDLKFNKALIRENLLNDILC